MMTQYDLPVRNNRGSVLVLIAISLTALLGIIGLAIDGGYIYMIRQKSQAAADAGALAAAYTISGGTAVMQTQAQLSANLNNVGALPATVVVNWPYVENTIPNNTKVEVVNVCSVTPFFLGMIGVRSITITNRAVAQADTSTGSSYNPFALGLFGNTFVLRTGGGTVDGYNSLTNSYNLTPMGEKFLGAAGSNGDFTMDAAGNIVGNVAVRGNANFTGAAALQGTIQALGNLTYGSSGVYRGNAFSNGSVTLSGNPKIIGDIHARGNLWIPNGNFTGNAYVNGMANLSGGGNNNTGNMYINGNLRLSSNITGNVIMRGNVVSGSGARVVSPGNVLTLNLGGANNASGTNIYTIGNANLIQKPTAADVPIVTLPPIDMNGVLTNNNGPSAWSVVGPNITAVVTNHGALPPDFTVPSWGNVTLQAGTYYFNTFSVSGTLILNGDVIIFANSFSSSGNPTYNQLPTPRQPSNFQLYVYANSGNAINVGNSGQLYMGIYAPRTGIVISGAAELYGAYIGNSFSNTAGGSFHIDHGMDAIAAPGSAGGTVFRLVE
jgi:cytoskeletal protein CcmA (bactofilin family)